MLDGVNAPTIFYPRGVRDLCWASDRVKGCCAVDRALHRHLDRVVRLVFRHAHEMAKTKVAQRREGEGAW